MQKYFSVFSVFLLITVGFSGCVKDECVRNYHFTVYEPVYMGYDEFRESVSLEPARELRDPGKIYLMGEHILINEIDKGIHIIDNANPASPRNIAFLSIPGNMDMAMRGHYLYADSYIDIITVDLSDLNNVRVTKRIEDVLPYRFRNGTIDLDKTKGVIVDYVEMERVETLTCQSYNNFAELGSVTFNDGTRMWASNSSSPSVGNFETPGIGGSMARFTMYEEYLYVIDYATLYLYNISSPSEPFPDGSVDVAFGIETIFPYMQRLFIGGQNGMYIYDNSNPSAPVRVSEFLHVRSCDPVVVEGNTAYVTLRGGSECLGYTNQLDIIDISDIANPTLIKSHDMHNPHGLGVTNRTVFICDGSEGLKVFNAQDPENIKLIKRFPDINAYDVIPLGTTLLMIGEDGFFQYDYSDLNNIYEISRIMVVK